MSLKDWEDRVLSAEGAEGRVSGTYSKWKDVRARSGLNEERVAELKAQMLAEQEHEHDPIECECELTKEDAPESPKYHISDLRSADQIHKEDYANDPEYRAAYDATREHMERWMAGEDAHQDEDWMGFTIQGPPNDIRVFLDLAKEKGLVDIDWCVMEHPDTLALAEFYPVPPREKRYHD